MLSSHYNTAEKITCFYKKIASVSGFLEWDFFVNMPKDVRIHSVETLLVQQRLARNTLSSEHFQYALEKALNETSSLSTWQSKNLEMMYNLHRLFQEVPVSLLEILNRSRLECLFNWNKARLEDNYFLVLPSFKMLFNNMREYLSIKSEIFGTSSLYETALLSFDQDLTTPFIDNAFAQIGKFLTENDEKLNANKTHATRHARNIFTTCKQKRLLRTVAKGFLNPEPDLLTLELGPHERFCYAQNIARMQVHYSEVNFTRGMTSFLRGLGMFMPSLSGMVPKPWVDQPIASVSGAILHEAIAALFSIHLYSSKEFADFILPTIKELFSGKSRQWETENILALTQQFSPSLIRNDCDEISSIAHLMMRYSIESELFSGNLSIEDIPDAWNEGTKHYFHSVPKSLSTGCLQDYHWFEGIFGYFPAAAMGIMNSHLLFEDVIAQKDILPEIASGNFAPLLKWLSTSLLSHGAKMSTIELIKKSTGANFRVGSYLGALKEKYSL